ncbi:MULTISPECIES: methyl-accepting chemotaxis protein [unclassified Oscillibacter]|uniref:methyl-accepting chemotaxis protein n=1 Tax=unclassified Oscillibacter TaxID=2629304 RepID=UPI0025FC2220|nr:MULTISPECIES: HAMP domain-containing methyl-accepting chemotaxis protein [unclassified Oscillibacter]
MKISTKLVAGFLVIALIAGAVGMVGLMNINALAKSGRLLYEKNTMAILYSGDANTSYQRIRYNVAEMLLMRADSLRDNYVKECEALLTTIEEDMNNYEAGITEDADQELFFALKSNWVDFKTYMQQGLSYAKVGQYDHVRRVLLVEANAVSGSLMDSFVKIYDYNSTQAAERAAENDQLAKISNLIMLAVMLAALAVAIVLGVLIARGISKPLNKVVDAADRLAKGDFNIDVAVNSKDETGMLGRSFANMSETLKAIIEDLSQGLKAFANGDFSIDSSSEEIYLGDYHALLENTRKMRDKLSDVLRSVNTAAEQVAVGAEQVSGGAQAMASGSTEQAATVEELNASIAQVAEQAENNLTTIKAAAQHIEQAVGGVNSSNEYMHQLSTAIGEISTSSNQIMSITKVIEDIAFQTNILALNAAIEAARAGNAGKGFAVVADEVRNLAGKSAEAARRTAELIGAAVSTVSRGTEITEKTAQELRNTEVSAKKVAESFVLIEGASIQQTDSIEQIRDGLNQISAVVQTNAATAEENSATSEEMSAQAVSLRQEVGRFRFREEGANFTRAAESASAPDVSEEGGLSDTNGAAVSDAADAANSDADMESKAAPANLPAGKY